MKRLGILLCSGLLVGASLGASSPNVLLIMADDLGYETLGCNGSASYKTPHLDQLARGGARMTHCYSQPLCTPTRVQIMTGRYFHRNYTVFGALKPGEKTFGHLFREAGYRTAVAGKWQLHGNRDTPGQSPVEAGFDAFCLWNLKLEGHTAKGNRYADPNLIRSDPATGKLTFQRFKGRYGPDICASYLDGFMKRSVDEGKPFLAYYAMLLPHGPFKPTPRSPAWNTQPHEQNTAYYKDMVEYMDELVGRLVGRLQALGVRDNTLVIFTGDNGTPNPIRSTLQDGRVIQGGKGFANNSGTHVPLIINWPGTIKPGQVLDALLDTSDFLPTLAEAAGLRPLKPPGDGMLDGRSFWPLLAGKPYTPRDWIRVHYTEPRQDQFGWPRARFVRNHRFKLYEFYERRDKANGQTTVKTGHLYDLEADPAESRPVARFGPLP